MLWVHRSNRLEELVEALLVTISEERPHPLQRQPIVVQGAGLDRYLAQKLAAHFGIWANASFPFPRNFFEVLFAQAGVGPAEAMDPYRVEVLAWAIAALLPQLWRDPAFDPIAAYARAPDNAPDNGGQSSEVALGREQFALAQRLAQVFDRYLVYRADVLHGWDHGADPDDWQAKLWRALTRQLAAPHFAARAKEWRERLEAADLSLPRRAYFFGLFHLPPLYLELLACLAERCEVHLFLLNPSPEYWAEIRSRRDILRQERERFGSVQQLEETWQQAVGHPLLASLGRVGAEQQAVLEGTVHYADSDCYVPPEEDSLLHCLQADLFALRRRAQGNPEAPPRTIDPADRSIQVHNCHSPMREVEVLHESLRHAFESDPHLRPEDCLVLCTDLETYAPLIHAVFGNPQLGDHAIPYQIADLPLRATEELVDAFFATIEFLRSRAPASALLSLLARPPVRLQFGFSLQDIDRLQRWIEELRVHWGFDAEHRAAEGLPAFREHTWQFALERLLVGAAMPPGVRELYGGVAPFPDVEGENAELTGKLAEACSRLRAFHRELQGARRVEEWIAVLDRLRRELFSAADPYAAQHQVLAEQLRELERDAARAGFRGSVVLEAVCDALAARLDEQARPYGFLAGGVNFCALRATRCIPARIVCLLGLREGAFPRQERPLPADRLVLSPRLGDPNARQEDRYAFLLALLSARDRFWITYCGQDLRNNSTLAPAPVVQELLDTIGEGFISAEGGSAVEQVVIRHPLHPFSPRYFRDSSGPLVSYSPFFYKAAAALAAGPRRQAPPWFQVELQPWAEAAVDAAQLVAFFRHPQREFLRLRFGILAREEDFAEVDEVPLELRGLEAWQLRNFLLDRLLEGEEPNETLEHARAHGYLPPGTLGELAWKEAIAEVETLAAAAYRHGGTCAGLTPRTFTLEFPGLGKCTEDGSPDRYSLTGRFTSVWPDAQVFCTVSKVDRFEELRAWLWHLLLNAVDAPDLPRHTVLIGRAQDRRVALHFSPVDQARELLENFLQWFFLGLRAPLPFHPLASRAYAHALRKNSARNSPAASAQAAAERALKSESRVQDDRADPAFLLLYGRAEPTVEDFDELRPSGSPTFGELAWQVFSELWAHCEEEVL